MASAAQLMAVGMPALQAQMLASGPITPLTPAGSSQGTSPVIASPCVILGTAAAAGVILPPSFNQGEITVFNNSGNTQNIYPAVGEAINALTANTAITLATAKSMNFTAGDKGWIAVLSA